MKKPELLAPAGSLKSMQHAFAYGADAVYAGQPRYSLRVRNNSFKKDNNLAEGISLAHAQGKNSMSRPICSRIIPRSKHFWMIWKRLSQVSPMP